MTEEEGVETAPWPVEYDDVDELIVRWVDIIKRNTDPEFPEYFIEIDDLPVSEEHGEYVDDDALSQTGIVLVFRILSHTPVVSESM